MVCLLSDRGADEDIAIQGGATPLLVASGNGHLEVVCLLSDAGSDEDIAMQGCTPLFVASQHGHTEVVYLLFDAGADKDIAMQVAWCHPLVHRISEWTPGGGPSAL